MLKYKIILAGDKDVGKSSLIARFCDNTFDENMQDTIGVSFKRKKVNIENQGKEISIEMNIWDLGGEEKYRSLFPSYANGASAALILFDTTNKKSMVDIENWDNIVDENASDDLIKLIIATKIDLKEDREVSKEEAINHCKKYRWCDDIITTSSKTGENVNLAFTFLAEEIIKKKFQVCNSCGEIFNKNLRICNYCGESI